MASCNSTHDWLVNLPMDLAAFCDIWRLNGTNECHLSVSDKDVAFSHHFVPTCPPLILPPCRSASNVGYTSKKHLKERL